MSRSYSRLEIDKAFKKIKFILHQEALVRGNGVALSTDSYTGKSLWGGESYDYDHIFPCEMIHSLYKDQLSDFQIAQVVNCKDNIGVTHRDINKSKGKKDPENWLADSKQITSQGINVKLAMNAIEKAKVGISLLADKLVNENGKIKV